MLREIVACLLLWVVTASAVYVPYCASPNPKLTRRYAIGSRITYSCPEGFVLVGEKASVCLLHKYLQRGYWSSPRPTCKKLRCPKLSNPENGSVRITGLTVGSTARYQCSNGFLLDGQSTRHCLPSGHWSGEAPTCKPIICPNLSSPSYGSVSLSGLTVGSTASYKCNNGFILIGSSTRQCLATGYWSGEVPICRPIECPHLSDPNYGSVSVSGLRVGSTASYKCNDGFTLIGVTTRRCLITGHWTGEAPTCRPIKCPDLSSPHYGSVSVSGLTVGSTASYKCNNGFFLIGTNTRHCLATGYWSGDEPICRPIECPKLPAPQYGSVSISGLRVGSTATYECNDGFTLVGATTRRCLSTGHWSGGAPSCQSISCPKLFAPYYGSVSTNGQQPGSIATYRCSSGFLLVGESTRRCLTSGHWSGKAPVCQPIKCPRLTLVLNGRITATGRRVGSTATHVCFDGFVLVGNSVRTCLNTGVWSGEKPSCQPVECPNLPAPSYGSVHLTGTTLDNIAIYTCDSGFQLVGEAVRRCLTSGQWSGQAPVCEPRGCGPPPKPHYGYVSYKNTEVGAKAHHYCNEGYTLSGSQHRVCLASGYWSGKTPVCLQDHY